MIKGFNNGKPYGGSGLVEGGKLKGATDTDYFYFHCPKCKDNRKLRILEYGVHEEKEEHPYNEEYKKKYNYGFTLVFHLYCDECKFDDFTKISNMGL